MSQNKSLNNILIETSSYSLLPGTNKHIYLCGF